MKDTPEHKADFDLLAKYFAGETSATESQQVESWLNASEENQAEFEALQTIWAGSLQVDADAAWQKVKSRTTAQPELPVKQAFPFLRWGGIAAAVVLLLTASVLFWPEGEPEWTTFATADVPAEIVLEEGSRILLNANSSLSYPVQFGEEDRPVRLEGEAFFEVERDENRPFRIEAGGAAVTVLGTSFNVKTAEETVEVLVATGKVSLQASEAKEAPEVILTPGEQGTFNRKTAELRETEGAPGNLDFWRTGTLEFRDRPLDEVVAELSKVFGIEIEMGSEAVGNCPLTATFSENNPESILKGIAETFNLTLDHAEEKYILSGEGCP